MKWDELAGHVARTVEIKCPTTCGKRPVGRLRNRWVEDNTKIDITEIRHEGEELIHLSQDWDQWQTLVNAVKNPPTSIKAGKYLD
jgi:hypothetical protein